MRTKYAVNRKSGYNIPLVLNMFLDPDNPYYNERNINPGQIIPLNDQEKNRILEVIVDVTLEPIINEPTNEPIT